MVARKSRDVDVSADRRSARSRHGSPTSADVIVQRTHFAEYFGWT